MKSGRSLLFYLTVLLVVVSVLVQETEARRKILRGRKALTRTYYRQNAVAAWVVSVLVGIGMLFVGAIVYFVMRKMVLGSSEPETNRVAYQPAMQNDV